MEHWLAHGVMQRPLSAGMCSWWMGILTGAMHVASVQ